MTDVADATRADVLMLESVEFESALVVVPFGVNIVADVIEVGMVELAFELVIGELDVGVVKRTVEE